MNMPHATCTVCKHEQRAAIDQALSDGSPSIRELASQTGLHRSAILRHKQHTAPDKLPAHSEIPKEIAKLRKAQMAAKKRRDTGAVLAISREIRAWMLMKARTRTIRSNDGEKDQELSRSEALALAKAIVESELRSPEVLSWVLELAERVRATGSLPNAPEQEQ
jgi:hypothetical protein